MISVIIPLYNGRDTIKKTIISILEQSYKDLEIIIVDDGSVDGSRELLATGWPIVHMIKQFHFGANVARNRGAKEAKGEYLFFCDDDVILKKDALEKLKKALDENEDASYAYCSFKIGMKSFPSKRFNVKELKKRNYISTMSLVRAKDFPGFDEKLSKFQDWDLWLTMLERGKGGIFVSEVLFYAKPSRDGKSRWLPRFFYKIPWLPSVKKYNKAREIIKIKHRL